MSRDVERFLEETLEQASRSAPVFAGVPQDDEKTASRWLMPSLAACAVGGIALAGAVLATSGSGDSTTTGPNTAAVSDAGCVLVDHMIDAAASPNQDLTGERLASRLNRLSHGFGTSVTFTYVPPDGYWLIVDDGEEQLVGDLSRGVAALSAPAPVMIRESCTSQGQLKDIQAQIGAEYNDGGVGGASSDLNLLEGRVDVFATSREVGDQIAQEFGDRVHVQVGLVDCNLLPGSTCDGTEMRMPD